MKFLNNLPIGVKLGGSFAAIVIILSVVIGLSYLVMSQLNQGILSLYSNRTVPIQDLGEVKASLIQIESNLKLFIEIPEPKKDAAAQVQTQTAATCTSCHADKANSSHHLIAGAVATDAGRCVACHVIQASDKQHGQAGAATSAASAATTAAAVSQDCQSCHPAETISKQRDQVEGLILADVAKINTLIAAYRAMPISPDENTELGHFNTAWASYQGIITDLLQQSRSGQDREALHRVVGGDAAQSQAEAKESLGHIITLLEQLAKNTQLGGAQTFNESVLRMVATGVFAILLAVGLGLALTQSMRAPLEIMARQLQNMQQGDLRWTVDENTKRQIISRSDEVGLAAQGLDSTDLYLQEMAEIANQIANGNLAVVVAPRSEHDELGIAFSEMASSLQSLIRLVLTNVNELNAASSLLASNSGQARTAIGQITTTVQQVALGINQQTESISHTAGSVEKLERGIDGVSNGARQQSNAVASASAITHQISQSVERVADNTRAVTRRSAEAAETARSGSKTIEETLENMQSIKLKVGVSAQKVQEMGSLSNQIGAIVETIDNISSQTNLLALNAAIEAARAGEHGAGFAVVADEVRKLAERSLDATKEITSLIKGIQKTVSEAVLAMQAGAKEVEIGVNHSNEAGRALTNILDAAEAVYEQAQQANQATESVRAGSKELVNAIALVSGVVEENTQATREMSRNAEVVTQAIENIASVSEENSASVEEVTASTEEVRGQIEEVSDSARSLEKMAQDLQEVMGRFQLDDSPAQESPAPTSGSKYQALLTPVR